MSSSHRQRMGQDLIQLQRELRAHALRLTRCSTMAEDLAQDTIERALRYEDRFEPGSNLRAWAHQILFHLFVSRCRKRRRESRALFLLSSDPCAWTAGKSTEAPYGELCGATRRAIDALPEAFRSTLEMVDVQQMSYQSAATALGVPVGTVMSRLHRARRLLAAALRDGPLAAAA